MSFTEKMRGILFSATSEIAMTHPTKVKKQSSAAPVQDEHGIASAKRFTAEMRVIVTRNKPKVLVDEFEEETTAFPYDPPVFH